MILFRGGSPLPAEAPRPGAGQPGECVPSAAVGVAREVTPGLRLAGTSFRLRP